MTAAHVAAQAKTNLRLRVVAREANGYHQIETLFCRLDLADTVLVRITDGPRSLDCRGEQLPAAGLGPAERNLAWRAATAFAGAAGWPRGFAIEIEKRIPVGGGLGGGSADAGAVLRCLDALAPQPLPPQTLLGIATALGADVPFLSIEAPLALAWGRGERLLALPPLPRRAVRLHCFDFAVHTGDAYAWLAERRGEMTPEASLLSMTALRDWDDVAAVAVNDFEPAVSAHEPRIAATLARLRTRALASDDEPSIVMLSGSGATVLAIGGRAGAAPPGERIIETHTSTSVAAVERLD